MNPESKNQRKQKARNAAKHSKKAMKMLKDFEGVTLSDSPSLCLFIGNGGMLCGISREYLLTLLEKNGSILDLVMLPKKSFALVMYSSKDCSKIAVEKLDGHVVANDNPSVAPFYIRYLNTESLDFAKEKTDHVVIYPYERTHKDLLVNGLECEREFVSEDYEHQLYEFFHTKCQEEKVKENTLKHRTVRHYGYQFLYGSNNIDKKKPLKEGIPDICKPLLEDMVNRGIIGTYPDQLTVNQYHPGQGIPPHIDTHSAFEDGIFSLTLNSQVCMDFTDPGGKTIPILLPRRSLLIMKGESRYLWLHGITPRKYDIVYSDDTFGDGKTDTSHHLTLRERSIRISLTFRKILHQPCRCNFPAKCDSQNEPMDQKTWELPSSQNEATKLEEELVYAVYENIAEHFSDTRHSPWPRVKQFLNGIEAGSLVGDVGCGNGKYLGVNKKLQMLGSDRSMNLVSICEERGHQVTVSDCLRLPYRSNIFDAAICIAVIHHLSTEQRRLDAVKELTRIVRVGGKILIYVWALEQESNVGDSILKKTAKVDSITKKVDEISIINETSSNENSTEIIGNPFKEGDSLENVDSLQTGDSQTDDSSSSEESKKYIQLQEGRNTFQQQDLLVPWHLKNKENNESKEEKVFHRFYHVFKEGELEELCLRLPNVKLLDLYLDCGNWCIILEKTKLFL